MCLQCHSPFVDHVKTVANVGSLVNNLILDKFSFLSQLNDCLDKLLTVAVFKKYNFFNHFAKSLFKNSAF